jgi:photosystem II stability/assembly factor-like uncharacterized protein
MPFKSDTAMKPSLLVSLFVFILLAVTAGFGLEWLNPSPPSVNYRSICMIDANNGWAVGSCGVAVHTTNGGQNWTTVDLHILANLSSVVFLGAERGWISGEDGLIMHTTDGGQSWTRQDCPTTKNVYNLIFTDLLHGWALSRTITASDSFLRTTDGGNQWNRVSCPWSPVSMTFLDARHGWLCTEPGNIYHTEDGGIEWACLTTMDTLVNIRQMMFLDSLRGWLLSEVERQPYYHRVLLQTTDGGIHWAVQDIGDTTHLSYDQIYFSDRLHGILHRSDDRFLRTSDGGNTWIIPDTGTSETSGNWLCMSFTDTLTGWAAGSYGRLIHTTDGGVSWNSQIHDFVPQNPDQPRRAAIFDIGFATTQRGWAVASGVILHTTNAGASWSPQLQDSSLGDIRHLELISPGHVWVITESGILLHSANGGESWLPVDVPHRGSLVDVQFRSENYGWVVSDSGSVQGTTDGGLTWFDRSPQPYLPSLRAIRMADSTHLWLKVEAKTFYKSSDAGLHWRRIRTVMNETDLALVDDFVCLDTNTVIVGGMHLWPDVEDATLIVTRDGGETVRSWQLLSGNDQAVVWKIIQSHFNGTNYLWTVGEGPVAFSTDAGATWGTYPDFPIAGYPGIAAADSGHLWTCGGTGTWILHSRLPGSSVVSTQPAAIPVSFGITRTYPNPFNPSTRIEFTLPKSGKVSLKVYDVLGREVAELVNETLNARDHVAVFNGSELPSGIYFARLEAAGLSQTRKMVLLK